ncbi:PIR Superfamily Protein [Plasmodium ovale curtisi]|uniref:PIR Superfamily Protein n=1 Tax=Plasmodium ovale curtisi TaxID=864141 RepID=A0A1A8WE80_PLAOA|nr:PIR Superfamily Protein [Plasmodium ovale curtisi]
MEREEILKNLSKYKLYKNLNETCDDKFKYDSYCQQVKYLANTYPGILEVCYMYARNLIYLHEVLKTETDNDERCRYINFWITDHIREKLETQWTDNRLIKSILRSFLQVEHAITAESKNNNCHFDYKSEVDINLWKEWKDLHDYIRNYNDINERINSHGNFCKLYSNYFAYIKGLHEKYKKECCNGTSDKCPSSMNLDYFCSSDRFMNKLKCDETKGITVASSPEERFRSMRGSHEGNIPYSEPLSPPEEQNDKHEDAMTNNTDYYTKLGIGLSFFGILSTFFYMYKFTTFGNVIHSKVLKTKIKVNLDEDAQNLMIHELNKEDESLYSDGYQIAYHPS